MDAMPDGSQTAERRISHLIYDLQNLVRAPSYSYRLEEIRAVAAQLMEVWMRYLQEKHQPPQSPPRSLGPPTTQYRVNFPYAWPELMALFAVASRMGVEQGIRYDLILTDFFGGSSGKVLTAAAGEAILGPWRGSV